MLRRIRSQSGFALPLALLVLVATSAILVTTITTTSSSGRTANLSKTALSAEAMAEAGIANALAILAKPGNNPNTQSILPTPPAAGLYYPMENGSATVWGTYNTTTYGWTLTSVGSLQNPTGGAPVTKTITKQATVLGIAAGATVPEWSRFIHDDAGTCFTIDTVTIPGAVASRGDMCLVNGGNVAVNTTGAATTAGVGDDLFVTGPPIDTGWRVGSAHNSGWGTDSANVYVSDNVRASQSVNGNSQSPWQETRGFGFTIPTGAVILGVEVEVERRASNSGSIDDEDVYLMKTPARPWDPIKPIPVTTGRRRRATSLRRTATPTTSGARPGRWPRSTRRTSACECGQTTTTPRRGRPRSTGSVSGSPTRPTRRLRSAALRARSCAPTSPTTARSTPTPPTSRARTRTASTRRRSRVRRRRSSSRRLISPGGGRTRSPAPSTFAAEAGNTFPNSFDNDAGTTSAPNNSVGGSAEITPMNQSYTCQVKENGVLVGEISWNHTTHVLTIFGTIYIDGDMRFDDNGQIVHYQGRGIIYASDDIEFDERVCAGGSGMTNCAASPTTMADWNPSRTCSRSSPATCRRASPAARFRRTPSSTTRPRARTPARETTRRHLARSRGSSTPSATARCTSSSS